MTNMSFYNANNFIKLVGSLENHPFYLTHQSFYLVNYTDKVKQAIKMLKENEDINDVDYNYYLNKTSDLINSNTCHEVQNFLTKEKRRIYNCYC